MRWGCQREKEGREKIEEDPIKFRNKLTPMNNNEQQPAAINQKRHHMSDIDSYRLTLDVRLDAIILRTITTVVWLTKSEEKWYVTSIMAAFYHLNEQITCSLTRVSYRNC